MNQKSLSNLGFNLTPRITEILTFVFTNPMLNQRQIADHFGITESRISQIMSSDRVVAAFPLLAKRSLKSMVPKAMKRYGELLQQDAAPDVARKVAEKILDTNHVLEPEKIEHIHSLSEKSLDELVQIINGAKQLPSPIIDTEVVSDDTRPQ